jgi:hypothetical protein
MTTTDDRQSRKVKVSAITAGRPGRVVRVTTTGDGRGLMAESLSRDAGPGEGEAAMRDNNW